MNLDQGTLFSLELSDVSGESVDIVRADHNVDIFECFDDPLDDCFLLHHASGKNQSHSGVAALQVFQSSNFAKDLVLGVFTDRASVDDDEISGFELIRLPEPATCEQSGYRLRIGFVGLAPMGFDVETAIHS
jgi:hypothetical protein